MAKLTLVLGRPGTGKTHSLQYLDPKETFIINTIGKDLSFKGWRKDYTLFHTKDNPKGNYIETHNADVIAGLTDKVNKSILDIINDDRDDIKNIVIDDFQYLMIFPFMNRIKEKGWDKFNEIGYDTFKILHKILSLSRFDLNVFVLCHTEVESKSEFEKVVYMKTEGNAVREHVDPEGLATVVLMTDVIYNDKDEENEYRFLTQNRNDRIAKSPEGMFDTLYIPNNLGFVTKKMKEYYYGENN